MTAVHLSVFVFDSFLSLERQRLISTSGMEEQHCIRAIFWNNKANINIVIAFCVRAIFSPRRYNGDTQIFIYPQDATDNMQK